MERDGTTAAKKVLLEVRYLYSISYMFTMVFRGTVGPKGQVTIPKELRERYHLLEGEEVLILPGTDGIVIKHPELALRGRLRGRLDLGGLEEDIRELRARWRT